MKQSFTAVLALTVASGVSAMPGHAAYVLESRNLAPSLVSRQTDSVGGTCGGSSGYVCESGSCCSQYGFCGTGAGYCDGTTGTTDPAPVTTTTAATPPATTSTTSSSGSGAGTCTTKTVYAGDGSTSAGWPSEDSWGSFDGLWSANLATISASCTQFSQDNNSDDETADIKAAITSIAQSSGVDARFILATIMQESKGCVRVPSTAYSVVNPGLMQDHAGSDTCYGVNPCPQSEIQGMIADGTTGTSSGDGLQQILSKLTTTGAQQVYQASRVYNSGSIPSSGDLTDGGATSSYASDIANRLTGCVF